MGLAPSPAPRAAPEGGESRTFGHPALSFLSALPNLPTEAEGEFWPEPDEQRRPCELCVRRTGPSRAARRGSQPEPGAGTCRRGPCRERQARAALQPAWPSGHDSWRDFPADSSLAPGFALMEREKSPAEGPQIFPNLPGTWLQQLLAVARVRACLYVFFLSGKGFKMQLNKKNILEQVSSRSFLSFCLMKAMSSRRQVSAGARWGVYEIPATFQRYYSVPLVCLP